MRGAKQLKNRYRGEQSTIFEGNLLKPPVMVPGAGIEPLFYATVYAGYEFMCAFCTLFRFINLRTSSSSHTGLRRLVMGAGNPGCLVYRSIMVLRFKPSIKAKPSGVMTFMYSLVGVVVMLLSHALFQLYV